MVFGLYEQLTRQANISNSEGTLSVTSVSNNNINPANTSSEQNTVNDQLIAPINAVDKPKDIELKQTWSETSTNKERKREFLIGFLGKREKLNSTRKMAVVDEQADNKNDQQESREPIEEQNHQRDVNQSDRQGQNIESTFSNNEEGSIHTAGGSKVKKSSKPTSILDRLRRKNKVGTVRAVASPSDNNTSSNNVTSATATELDNNKESSNNTGKINSKQSYYETNNQLKVIYYQFGAPNNVLQLEMEDGIPSPDEPDHVVIEIEASSVSIQDCLTRRGYDFNIFNPRSVPIVPGCDVVGHIISAGHKAYPYKEGDRVAALLPNGGGNARYISLPTSVLLNVPTKESCDACDVISMISVFVAAYQILKRIKQPTSATAESSTTPTASPSSPSAATTTFTLQDKKVLIVMGQGRTDPIGHALIQMCHKAKAVIFVTAPIHKHHYYRTVLRVVPLPDQNWLPYVEHKMDYVFDGLCADGLATPCMALKKDLGEIVCYGHTSLLSSADASMGILGAPVHGYMNKFQAWNRSSSMFNKYSIQFYDVHESYRIDPITFRKNLKSLFQLYKLNKLKPCTSQRVALEHVSMAQHELEQTTSSLILPELTIRSNKDVTADDTKETQQQLPSSGTIPGSSTKSEDGGIVVCIPWMLPSSLSSTPSSPTKDDKKSSDQNTNRKKTWNWFQACTS